MVSQIATLWNLTFFTDKHNHYASRTAPDMLHQRLDVSAHRIDLTSVTTTRPAEIIRFVKEPVYNQHSDQLFSVA